MTTGKQSWYEKVRGGMHTEEEAAFEIMFPFQDKFRRLQMMTDVGIKSQMPWSVLGVFRQKYDSKLLKSLQVESGLNKISLDRKGRGEASEITVASRRPPEKDSD